MSCALTYLISIVVIVIMVVLFHFYVIAPFLVSVLRGQQEKEIIAMMIRGKPESQSRIAAAPSKELPKTNIVGSPQQRSTLVKPLESIAGFFRSEKAVTTYAS